MVGVEVGSIIVTPDTVTIIEGDDQQFRAIVEDTEGRPIQRADLEWASDDPGVLSIDADGMAVAILEGTATVTATYAGAIGTAEVEVTPAPAIAVSESTVFIRGATGAQSPAAVVLDVTNSGGGRLDGLDATVQFAAGGPQGWLSAILAAPQAQTTLTLTPQTQTLPLGTYEATVVLTSTAPRVSNSPLEIPVTLTLTGFTIVESGGSSSVTEAGSTDDFTVVLDAAPVSDVVMSVMSTDTTEVSVSPAQVTFTPANWDTPQTVTMTGRDDLTSDGDLPVDVTVSVVDSLSDDTYDPIPDKTVTVTVSDDDVASITVTPTSGLVTTEARGQATFSVRLDTGPTADVTIGLTSSDTGEGTVGPASLTFTPANWSTAQTVTVTGVNDEIDDDDVAYTIVTAPATSTDPAFAGLDPADVSVTNSDDGDAAGVTVTPTTGLVTTEAGGQATFQIVLDSEPTADVTIAVSSGDPTEGSVNPTSVTFTPVNWDIARLVTVSSLDDLLPDGDVIYLVTTAAATSTDPKYAGLDAADVTVTNVDDESAGITVSQPSGPTTEAGGQATFTVVLNNEPAGDVTIGLTSSDTGEGTISTSSVLFTPANWDTPQPVTVTGIDDDVDDGDVVYTVVTAPAASTDPNYDGVNAPNVTLANVDDDQAGFLVSSPSGPTTEAGGQSTFTVLLTSEPLADVTIGVSSTDTSEGTVVPPSLTFTPTSWDTPQTVTVTGQNDALADGNIEYTIVTGAATSSDPAYGGRNPDDVVMTNVDDESAGITVSAISGPTTESGGTGTFTVVLNTEPSAPVTIGVASSDTGEGTLAISSVAFTVANWDTPQTVTVTGIDDDLDDGDVAYTIVTAAATSSDPDYSGVDAADVAVTNVDDDSAGFLVSPPSGPTTEAGVQADFTVRLTSQPGADVTISLSSSDTSEGTVTPASLTFTPATWSVAQTVTATGQDDDQADGNVVYAVVTGVASSGDPRYNGINPPNVSLTNVDDESAGITVSPISQPTTEDGGQATFTMVLNAQPTDDVTVGLSTSDATEGTISTSSVLFTSANWDTPQPVTVTGVNDDVDDDNVAYTIATAPAVSADAGYDGIDPADVLVTNVDDDQAGFLVSPATGPTTEAGGMATFTVRLTSEPTASVTVGVSSDDTSEGTVAPASLLFSTASWSTPQTVTVTGQNDLSADGNIVYTIELAPATSTDTRYSGRDPDDVAVTNVDDETAGITVSPISRATTEAGGTATFSVVLNTQPSAGVTIGLSSSDTNEGTVSAASIAFTTADWDTPQTVTVTGVGDDVDDGDVVYSILTAAATSGDPAYDGLDPVDVAVTNVDDDTAGFLVSAVSGPTTEAGTLATFTVRLTSQPLASVSIGLSSSDGTEGSVNPASLTFTTGDWSGPRTVTVTGQDDLLADGNVVYTILTAAATSTDPTYAGLNPADVSLTNVDDETPGITVSPASGPTTEAGGQATFTVVLNNEPSGPVSLSLTSSDATEGTIAPTSLIFTASNWSTPQPVTVTGQNDAVDDDNVVYTIVTGAATSADLAYDGINPSDVSVTNIDDDVAGFTVTPATGPTTEASGSATFTVALTSEPIATVTIDLSSSDGTEGSVSPGSLTFTTGDWNSVRTVTVTGLNDDVDDGNIAYTIVTAPASSTDPKYLGLNPADVSVTNVDDDVAGFTVSAPSAPTTEAGGQATFTVRLTSRPTSSVTIDLTSSETTEGTVAPGSLSFDTGNWSTPQAVTVTGVDDDFDDGNAAYSIITGVAVSADLGYNGLNPADVNITNVDDDQAGFAISAPSGPTTELNQGTATFTVALTSRPADGVTLGLISSDPTEGIVSPAILAFAPAVWNVPQPVTVTGVDDFVADGNVVYDIVTDAAVSSDPLYSGLDPADVAITNVDNETVGITVSAASGPTTEAGGQAVFVILLNTLPTADVTIALSSSDDGEGTVSPASVTFTPANWSTPRPVTVTGVDDGVDDGDVAYTIVTAAATSTDPSYNGLNPADVSVTNIDDDAAALSIGNQTVTEGTGSAVNAGFAVTLSVPSTQTITVQYSTEDGTAVAPADFLAITQTLTFNPGVTSQTANVSVVGDALDEDDETFFVNLASPTNAVIIDAQGVGTITDNDPLPALSINDPSVIEGDLGGTVDAVFTVTLSPASGRAVTVDWATSDVTATAGADYTANSGVLTFPAGMTTQDLTVVVQGDALDEDDNETFNVTLSNPGNASISDGTGAGTITDDDPPPSLVIANAMVAEGNSGSANASFTVTLSPASGRTVTVNYATGGGNATAGTDYTSTSGQLPFTPGQTTRTILVPILGDSLVESNETFEVTLTGPSNAVLADDTGLGTITNDDTPGFALAHTNGSTVTTEEGPTPDSVSIVLTRRPQSNVQLDVTVSSAVPGEATVSPTSVSFTNANWNVVRWVSVTAFNGANPDGNQPIQIVFTINQAGTEPLWDGVAADSLPGLVVDDDGGQQQQQDELQLTWLGAFRGLPGAPTERISDPAARLQSPPRRSLGYSASGLRQ